MATHTRLADSSLTLALREERYASRLTLDEVAARTGLHRDTVYRMEHGQASDRVRRLVAHALGVYDELYDEDAR
jgi:transcriptional regulator with XRE-family HTH domain